MPQLIAQLTPVITSMFQEVIDKMKPRETVYNTPAINPADQARAHNPAMPAPKVKPPSLPVIGVYGPIPSQQQILKAAYPNLDLVFVEKDNGNRLASTFRSCVRIIGMTSHMNHGADGTLKKHFNGHYCRVTGGVTSIKHQIDVWIKTGEINERRAETR